MKTEDKSTERKPEKKEKRTYLKPEIQSEKLNSYGAICNGTSTGGRKATIAGPAFCNAGRLNS